MPPYLTVGSTQCRWYGWGSNDCVFVGEEGEGEGSPPSIAGTFPTLNSYPAFPRWRTDLPFGMKKYKAYTIMLTKFQVNRGKYHGGRLPREGRDVSRERVLLAHPP
jgi:hypothetical protein